MGPSRTAWWLFPGTQCDGRIPDPEGLWPEAPNWVFANRVPAASTLRVNRKKGSWQKRGKISKRGQDLGNKSTGNAGWGHCKVAPRAPRSKATQARELGAVMKGSGAPTCLTHPHPDLTTPCQPPCWAPTWEWGTGANRWQWGMHAVCRVQVSSGKQYSNSHKKWKGSMTLLQKFVLKLYTNVCNHRDGGLGFLALALMSVKCWRWTSCPSILV